MFNIQWRSSCRTDRHSRWALSANEFDLYNAINKSAQVKARKVQIVHFTRLRLQTDGRIADSCYGRACIASRGKIHVAFSAFCRTMLCKRSLCRHTVSVRPSVTFVDSLKTNKHIFNFFNHRVATPFLADR